MSGSWPIMKIFLKFGIGADSSTFGLPRFAMPRYEMGVFKMGVFKTRKIKTGFAENLGHCLTKKLLKPNMSNIKAFLIIPKSQSYANFAIFKNQFPISNYTGSLVSAFFGTQQNTY